MHLEGKEVNCNTTQLARSRTQSVIRVARAIAAIAASLLIFSTNAFALEVPGCGTVGISFLVDYRAAKSGRDAGARTMLKTVEDAHFTAAVEMLRSGKSTTRPGPDISYTLERFPNHHRALFAIIALGEKEKTSQPTQSSYSVECWLKRAVAWVPDDNTVKLIYAQYLYKAGRGADAEVQLSAASRQAGDNAFTLHNIGLVYFDAKNYEQALLHAHKAYALGLGTPTLKEQLMVVGKWTDLPAEPTLEPAKTP